MTSTFTPKAQNDTVSQTNKRSFSQVSATEEATNDNTNSMSFDLNIQNLMPLIEQLKEQNEQLKHERDQIQFEMSKLKSVSEGILQENNIMKQHYQQRTEDIKKIVATMSINMNEEFEDINHMIHMTKNHNFAIVKNIEMAKKQIQQKDQEIVTIENQLAELAQKNTLLQQEIITRSVKIRQMEQKMEKVQHLKRQEDNLFKLEEEVDTLVQEVQALREVNTKKLKSTQTIQTRNQLQKPQYTAQNLNVIQTIKALQQQISQLREDSSAFEKNLETLKAYHKKVSEKCQRANQEREHQTLQIDAQENEIKLKKQKIYHNKTNHKEKEIKKSELEDQKYQLEKQLIKRQQRINKIKSEKYKETEGKKAELKEKLARQKTEHKVEIEKSYDELKFKLGPEKERKEEILEELKQEFEELEREVDEMKRTVKNMDNPVKEIIRLEYELKRLNN